MFENLRRGRQSRNFTINAPKILDLKSSSEQIFSENWRWVPLIVCLVFQSVLVSHGLVYIFALELKGKPFVSSRIYPISQCLISWTLVGIISFAKLLRVFTIGLKCLLESWRWYKYFIFPFFSSLTSLFLLHLTILLSKRIWTWLMWRNCPGLSAMLLP